MATPNHVLKVTAIKQQVKRQSRYSIFIDGRYAFSLSDVALLDSKLVKGQQLSEAEIRDLQQMASDDKSYSAALAYATLRPRSVWEMEQYLTRKKSDPELKKAILSKLSRLGLLNDEAFARSWVANRRLLKPVSRRKLLQELRAKRVSEDDAMRALDEDTTDEKSVLSELIISKRKQSRYQDDQKLMRYLAGQGFSYGDIKDALDQSSRS